MRPSLFSPLNSVLLVGEGNFSFAVGLIDLSLSINVVATCFETTLTEQQRRNVELLSRSGVQVITGVDATKLQKHPVLRGKCFDKIIFNFPHVGGKMKIHLNRALVREFFSSASHLLNRCSGNIIVSLCSGQGADYAEKRCWADSWQIVEMAGRSDLLLIECSSFWWDLFPAYVNVGYRSLEKGFHTEGALVHVFSYVEPPFSNQSTSRNYCEISGASYRPAYAHKINRNILRGSSVVSYFLRRLLTKLDSKQMHQVLDEDSIPHFAKNGLRCSLLNVLHGVFQKWNQDEYDAVLYSGVVFNELGGDFQVAPVTVQTLSISKEESDVYSEYLGELRVKCSFKSIKSTSDTDECLTFVKSTHAEDSASNSILDQYIFVKQDKKYTVTLLHTDSLSSSCLRLSSWRQVWAAFSCIEEDRGVPKLRNICPYPIHYTFDLSFILSDTFSEDDMYSVLWDVAADFIVSVQFVNEFVSPDKGWRSQCYRFTYMSYDKPFCRERALFIHQEIVGFALSSSLGVIIR